MKRIASLLMLVAFFCIAKGQETKQKTEQTNPPQVPKEYFNTGEASGSEEKKEAPSAKEDENNISRFALSVNPLGFVQFGPMINAEFGITKNLVLNAHVRFPTLGLLTIYTYDDDGVNPDELSGYAFGGGMIYFFGEKRNKPYAGAMIEYQKAVLIYDQGETWETEETDNSIGLVLNGGYRFRFKGGFFINTGAYLGAAYTTYTWFYTDPSYVSYDYDEFDGTEIFPFGMVEVTVGIEF